MTSCTDTCMAHVCINTHVLRHTATGDRCPGYPRVRNPGVSGSRAEHLLSYFCFKIHCLILVISLPGSYIGVISVRWEDYLMGGMQKDMWETEHSWTLLEPHTVAAPFSVDQFCSKMVASKTPIMFVSWPHCFLASGVEFDLGTRSEELEGGRFRSNGICVLLNPFKDPSVLLPITYPTQGGGGVGLFQVGKGPRHGAPCLGCQSPSMSLDEATKPEYPRKPVHVCQFDGHVKGCLRVTKNTPQKNS